jgi:hypothetical protein
MCRASQMVGGADEVEIDTNAFTSSTMVASATAE